MGTDDLNLVVRIEFGSHLYGTSTPTSDHDYKSIYIPCASDILLQRVKGSTGHKVKRFEREKNAPEDTDDEAYSLQRYLTLLAEGQTVTIDMLFAPNPLVSSPLWDELRANKDRLLTKRSAAFVGYCRTQANKYGIKGSRVASAKKAAEFFSEHLRSNPTTAKVGDLDPLLSDLFDDHTKVITKETTPGKFETYFECCNRMVGFKNTLKEAAGIYTRIYDEYGHRARLAQTNEGIDWKALSHAVRVANEAVELLMTANVTFPLVNADHILAIKRGLLSYEQVAEEIERLLLEVERASEVSTLRDNADSEFIDSLVKRVYRESVLKEAVDVGNRKSDAETTR
jgi:RNA repair pathway DNA polymerase beta family